MLNFVVLFGKSARWFATNYHAEQFKRALTLNGTRCELLTLPEFQARSQTLAAATLNAGPL